jgi:hypothetical protein
MEYKPHFQIVATDYDEHEVATDFQILFTDPEDDRKAKEIMRATGVATELEALFMVFRRYQPDFLDWWNGDNSKAPKPLDKDTE